MNKLMISLLEPMKELQMFERIVKDPKGIYMEVKDSTSSSQNKKKKNSFKKSKQGNKRVGKEKSKCKGKCSILWQKEPLEKEIP